MSEIRQPFYVVESCDIAAFKVTVLVEECHVVWSTDAETAKREVLAGRGERVTIARHPVEVVSIEEVTDARSGTD